MPLRRRTQSNNVATQTAFYKPALRKKATPVPIIVPLRRGTALLHRQVHAAPYGLSNVSSYIVLRHGKECMLHEGRQVLAGTKLVLRSDLMFSRL